MATYLGTIREAKRLVISIMFHTRNLSKFLCKFEKLCPVTETATFYVEIQGYQLRIDFLNDSSPDISCAKSD